MAPGYQTDVQAQTQSFIATGRSIYASPTDRYLCALGDDKIIEGLCSDHVEFEVIPVPPCMVRIKNAASSEASGGKLIARSLFNGPNSSV
jgi:hypothetical protein